MDNNSLINGLRIPQDDELARTMTHAGETPEMRFNRRLVDYAKNRAMAPVNAVVGLKDLTERAMHGEQVSDDPSAGFQALRGMSWLSGLAPSAPRGAVLPAVLGPRRGPLYDRDALYHSLINPKTGEEVGYITMQKHPDNSLHVGMVQGTQGGPWQEGFSGTKELLKSIKETYPEATGIGGFRISGARAKASATGPAKMSFGEKRFDPEELARNAKQAAELRARDEEYWRNASSQTPEQSLNAFDQDSAARRRAFEDSHALARIQERLSAQQGARLTPESERNWDRLTAEMHQQEMNTPAPRVRRSTEEIRRMAGPTPATAPSPEETAVMIQNLLRGLGAPQ